MTDCTWIEACVVDYQDDALEAGSRAEVERHLSGCAACRATASAYRSIRDAYRETGDADAPTALGHSLLVLAAEELRPGSVPARAPTGIKPWVWGATAAVLLCCGWWVSRGSFARPDPSAPFLERARVSLAASDRLSAAASLEAGLAVAESEAATAELLFQLGEVYTELELEERALEHLDRLALEHPTSRRRRDGLRLRADLLTRRGRVVEAEAAFRLLVREFPAEHDEALRRLRAVGVDASFEEELRRNGRRAIGYLGYIGDVE